MPNRILTLPEIMRSTIERYNLISYGDSILVAVSGGPDSMALLHLLSEIRSEWNLKLAAAHVNHGLRGKESDGDAKAAADFCSKLGIELHTKIVDVAGIASRLHLSTQEAARDARSAFLQKTAMEAGAVSIAYAHTRDDLVETILLNILRGSGIEGIAGFPPKDGIRIRPLYEALKSDAYSYCMLQEIAFRIDSSNSDLHYRRNRIRAELLPHLRAYYNQGVEEALLRLAKLAESDNEYMDRMANEKRIFLQTEERDGIWFDRSDLMQEPLSLQRRILRGAIMQVRKSLYGVPFHTVEQALQAAASGKKASYTLPLYMGVSVALIAEPDRVSIKEIRSSTVSIPWERELKIPGVTILERPGLMIEATIMKAGEAPPPESILILTSEFTPPLAARSWRAGDRIRLSFGTRKLQDIFTDAKIPSVKRGEMAIITDGKGIILSVPGVINSSYALPPRPEERFDQLVLALTVREQLSRLSL